MFRPAGCGSLVAETGRSRGWQDGIMISGLARDFRRQKTLLTNPAVEEEPEGEQARVLSPLRVLGAC